MEMKLKQGTVVDMAMMTTPLKQSAPHLVAEMHKRGEGKRCGVCGKPFNSVRKWRSVARVVVGRAGGSTMAVHWLLCGACKRNAIRDNKGRVPALLRNEAYEVASQVLPMIDTKTEGAA